MTVRDSAGVFLQIISTPPAVAVGIEIDVYGASNLAQQIDTLEAARQVTFQKQLNQVGAGALLINRHDAKATSANLQKGNLMKVKINGNYVGGFFAEESARGFADPAGAGSEDFDIKGRGQLAYTERAIVYPTNYPTAKLPDVVYTTATRGAILANQIAQAKARGGLAAMSYDFSAALDSQSNPWTDTNTLTFHIGLSLLSLATQLAALGTDIYMDPLLNLHAYHALGVDRTGASAAAAVVFRQGHHIGSQPVSLDEHNSAVRSRLLVEGAGNNIQEVLDAPIEADTTVGRREGYLSYTASGDTQALNDAGAALLTQLALDAQPLQVTVTHGLSSAGTGDYEPFVDYDVGDWVVIDVPGAYDLAALRVVGITIQQIEGGDYTVALDLNSVYLEALIRQGQVSNSLSGGSSNTSGLIGSGSSQSAGSGRVASAVGDSPGYLFDKITAGAGIAKALLGTAPAETVSLIAQGMPAGGIAGQGLTKIDATDYHTQWVTPSGGGGGGTTRPLVDPTGLSWSWINQGVATVSLQGAAILLHSPVEGADNWHFRVKSVPTKPYTVIVHFYVGLIPTNYPAIGIGWLRSSDNHFAIGSMRGDEHLTSSVANSSSFQITGHYVDLNGTPSGAWGWMKLTDNSSVRTISLSRDGYNWVLFHSIATNTDVTPDRLIFGLEARSGFEAALTVDSWEEF